MGLVRGLDLNQSLKKRLSLTQSLSQSLIPTKGLCLTKSLSLILSLSLSLVLLLGSAGSAAEVPDYTGLAKQFVQLLSEERYADAVKNFDAAMTQAMSADALQAVWKQVQNSAGAFRKIMGTTLQIQPPYVTIRLNCAFAAKAILTRVVFDRSGKITGLFFQNPEPTPEWRPPTYVASDSFTEEEIGFGLPDWQLPGTLTIPRGAASCPAVVLVHGSGPNDRDETLGPNKPFRDLAWGLASRGIAVLRYEKRTRYHSEACARATGLTLNEETVADAVAAVHFLRADSRIDPNRVMVLGHSLGGLAAPLIGQTATETAGLIIMAGINRSLEDVFIEQIAYVSSVLGKESQEAPSPLQVMMKEAVILKAMSSAELASSSQMILSASPEYWLYLRGYDPLTTAQAFPRPILILQGERDYQATMVDFRRWQEALQDKPGASFSSYPDLNHLFMTGTGKAVPQEYVKPGNVAPEVIDRVATWILER